MGVLQELLGADEPLFSLALRQLETASGHMGRDARLVADIAVKVREGTTQLGLDPADTTGRELFAALMARIERDDRRLMARIGAQDLTDTELVVRKITALTKKADISLSCWAMKRPAAKRLLKTTPPKTLMKKLGYRSVDSLLKHESIDSLMLAVRYTEDEKWRARYLAVLAKVKASDFEARDIAVVALDKRFSAATRLAFIGKTHSVVHVKEMGVVGLVAGDTQKGAVLMSLVFVLHYIAELRSYTAFFKLRQVDKDFGDLLVRTLADDVPLKADIAGHAVHWRVVHRFFGSGYEGEHPELFEPHIQPEDLVWTRAEHMLEQIDSDMGFWTGKDYVGIIKDERVITLNLLDVCLAYANSIPYESFVPVHFRDCLWNELLARYLGARSLQEHVLSRLESPSFIPEDL